MPSIRKIINAFFCFLNYEEIKKRITKIKHFINKYNWEVLNFHLKKVFGKSLRKIM